MGKKNRKRQSVQQTSSSTPFAVNPFAGLDTSALDLPSPGPAPSAQPVPAAPLRPRLPPLWVRIERKGRAGKTATLVGSFADLPLDNRMALLGRIRKALGTGARFTGDDLELQGDQRTRAAEWLAANGYKLR